MTDSPAEFALVTSDPSKLSALVRAASQHRFPSIDRTGRWDDFREVIDGPVFLEPHDDRTDECVSIPVRSVISATAGPAVEIGPFTLDTSEVVKLYNALASHIGSFPSEFRPAQVEQRVSTR